MECGASNFSVSRSEVTERSADGSMDGCTLSAPLHQKASGKQAKHWLTVKCVVRVLYTRVKAYYCVGFGVTMGIQVANKKEISDSSFVCLFIVKEIFPNFLFFFIH